MSKETQTQTLGFGLQVLNALETDPKVGIQLLRDRATAERNNGAEDQAKAYEQFADSAETQGPQSAFKMIAGLVGHLPGAKDAMESIVKTREESRAESLQPWELAQKKAMAEKTGFEAQSKGIEAATKQLEFKYAPQRIKLEIDQLGASLGLTKAQTSQANQAAELSRASAREKKAIAEEISRGIMPSEKRPEAETKLRTEYNNQTKVFQDVRDSYSRIQASENTAVGDLSLIFGYMKMLDPGSVVREGEFANAQNAAGVDDKIINIYNRVMSGERLSAGQRTSFKGQAGKLYDQAEKQEKVVRSGISRIASGYGLNKDNIFYQPEGVTRPTPSADVKNISVDY